MIQSLLNQNRPPAPPVLQDTARQRLLERLKQASELVPLSEAKQRFNALPLGERSKAHSALFRMKRDASGKPAGNVQGSEGYFVSRAALESVEGAFSSGRTAGVTKGTQEFIAQRTGGSLRKRLLDRPVEQRALITPSGPAAPTQSFGQRMTALDPLAGVSGVVSQEEQAEQVSPKTFPLARRGDRPIATFKELRRDLGDEMYSQGFQKIASIGGRLDPKSDPVAFLSGIILTGSLITPLEIERTNTFIAQRDAQVARGEAPPIAQDLKDRIGATANYAAVASGIFGPAQPISKLALAKSVLKHSHEPTLQLFKSKVLRDALDSADRGFKEAALNLAKMEPEKVRFADQRVQKAFNVFGKNVYKASAAETVAGAAKGADTVGRAASNAQEGAEQAAKQEGVGLSFRAPKADVPGVEFRPKAEPAPGYTFRSKTKEPAKVSAPPEFRTGKAVHATKDFDEPVTVEKYLGERGGRHYVKVEGSEAGIPLDEVKFEPTVAAEVPGPKTGLFGKARASGTTSEAPATFQPGTRAASGPTAGPGRTQPQTKPTPTEAPLGTQPPSAASRRPFGATTSPRSEGTPKAPGFAFRAPKAAPKVEPDDLLGSPKLADIGRVRKSLGLPQYTKDKRSWDSVIEQVAKKGLHQKAEGIAQDVIEKGRLLNEEETVAVGVAARNLQNKLNRLHAEKAKFIEAGSQSEADLTEKLIVEAQKRADDVTTALSRSRSRTGATLNIGKIALPDQYDSTTLRAKAVSKANRKLKTEEAAKVDEFAARTAKAKQTADEAESKWVKARVTAALRGLDTGSSTRFGRVKVDKGPFSDDAAEKALARLQKRSGFGGKRTTRGAANLPVDDVEALITVLGNQIAKGARNHDALIADAKSIVAGLDDIEGADALQEAVSRVYRSQSPGSSFDPDLFIRGEWGVMDGEIGQARAQLKAMGRTVSDQFYDPGLMLDRVEEMQKQLDRLEGFVKKGDKAQADKVRSELALLGRDFNKGVKEGDEFLRSGDFAVMDKSVAEARQRWRAMMADTDAYIESLTPTGFIEATRAAARGWGFTNIVNRLWDVAQNQFRLTVEGSGKVVDPLLERGLFPRQLKGRQATTALPNIRRGREAAQGYWRRVGERMVRQATVGESRLLLKVGAPRGGVNTAANFAEGSRAERAARVFDKTTNALNRLPGYTDIPASQWAHDATLLEMVDNFVAFEAKGKGWSPDQVALLKKDVIANVDGKYDELFSVALEESHRAVFMHDSWFDGVYGGFADALRRTTLGRTTNLAIDTFITRYPLIFAKIADYTTDFAIGGVKAGVRSVGSGQKAKAARKIGEEYAMPLHEQRLITQLVRRNMQGAAILALGGFTYGKLNIGELESKKQFIDHGDFEHLGGPFALYLLGYDQALLKDKVAKGQVTEKQAQNIAFQTWVNLVANQPLVGESDRALRALTRGEGLEKFIGSKTSATLLPGILRESARRTDNVRIRETKDDSSLQTILNEFKKNVPGLRQQLPERGAKKPTGQREQREQREQTEQKEQL